MVVRVFYPAGQLMPSYTNCQDLPITYLLHNGDEVERTSFYGGIVKYDIQIKILTVDSKDLYDLGPFIFYYSAAVFGG